MSVHSTWDDDMLVITLDRPHRRNAVDHETLLSLRALQDEAMQRQVRAVVLTGTPPAFCAGADLNGVENDVFASALSAVLRGFTMLPAVTVAAVDGPALGAGTQLVVACDVRVATPSSTFGIPAAKLGLAVDSWTVHRLGCEFGWSTARAMLLAAATRTADQLHDVGAIHRLGDLDSALDWAREIAALAPLTVKAHKRALEHALQGADPDPGAEEARHGAWASADAEEGRRAFLEKRPPQFRGR
jgi:enoyl-CoA hydratase